MGTGIAHQKVAASGLRGQEKGIPQAIGRCGTGKGVTFPKSIPEGVTGQEGSHDPRDSPLVGHLATRVPGARPSEMIVRSPEKTQDEPVITPFDPVFVQDVSDGQEILGALCVFVNISGIVVDEILGRRTFAVSPFGADLHMALEIMIRSRPVRFITGKRITVSCL